MSMCMKEWTWYEHAEGIHIQNNDRQGTLAHLPKQTIKKVWDRRRNPEFGGHDLLASERANT